MEWQDRLSAGLVLVWVAFDTPRPISIAINSKSGVTRLIRITWVATGAKMSVDENPHTLSIYTFGMISHSVIEFFKLLLALTNSCELKGLYAKTL
jgi:hypothetical protein